MEIRSFGSSPLRVSALGFGAAHVGRDDVDDAEAARVLGDVLDAGITLIDTARGYGCSEERIGRHIAHRRDEYVLSSKCGYGIDGVADWTPQCIDRGIDQALRLLKTDRIDIMHLHSCPAQTLRSSGVVEALVRAREAGKILLAAYSGENEDLDCALELGVFDSIQASANICDQRGLDSGIARAHRDGLGVIAKRPVANAFWRFSDRPVGDYCEVYWERAQTMALEPPAGMPWAELAIRFVLGQRGISSAIIGTANRAHLAELIEAAGRGPVEAGVNEAWRAAFRHHGSGWTGQV